MLTVRLINHCILLIQYFLYDQISVQFEKKLRDQYLENLNVEKNITTSQDNLRNHDKKVEMIDRLLIVASESLPNYFDKVIRIAGLIDTNSACF